MALISSIYYDNSHRSVIDNDRIQSSHVSSTAKNTTEDKNSYLADDKVTLSTKEDQQSQNREFSHNRYQAISAYKRFSVQDAFERKTIDLPDLPNAKDSDSTKSADLPELPGSTLEKSDSKESFSGSTDTKDTSENQKDTQSVPPEKKTSEENDRKPNGEQLTDQEQNKVNQMKERDTEVRTHELAHARVGGQYAGSPIYEKEQGPDGKDYITDGHVNIDMSSESTNEKTVQKMQQVIRAAKAPAEPSGQDMKVAAEAQQKLNEAQSNIMKESAESDDNKSKSAASASANSISNEASPQGTASDTSQSANQNESISKKMDMSAA